MNYNEIHESFKHLYKRNSKTEMHRDKILFLGLICNGTINHLHLSKKPHKHLINLIMIINEYDCFK